MKLFLDTANIEEIKKVNEMGLLNGVTTNPTIIAKQLTNTKSEDLFKETKKILKEICSISEVPVLAEPISQECENIVEESIELSEISSQIVAKIPLTQEGLKAVKILKERNIKTALTLIFSLKQALIAAISGVEYICPFVGRLDDIGEKGIELIYNIVKVYKVYNFKTKIIVASVRNIEHIINSAIYGADAVTVPYKLIDELINHPLTQKGIEKFLEDWSKLSNR
ncbi:MAG: fructose-6-phosphate aldolase [Elusimicrobiota bacterium]|nr:fructose-6-phosphate aldolase [Endomicrobiia bacterium]MCX7910808.1 fructose-6-phosphate aldolase [Endomicrobiia bacterium]MDW8165382.1 fructose-6-phosphate aldolase [Elusimicrobiota bacterium]